VTLRSPSDGGLRQRDWVRILRMVFQVRDLDAREAAYAVFERVTGLDPAAIGAVQSDGELPYLRFTPEAQELFDEWRRELELRLRDPEMDHLILSHLGKFRSLIPSLALLTHLADEGCGPVGVTALHRACAWGEYLESHAGRFYAPVVSSGVSGAHALAKRLRRGDLPSGFTLRELYRKHWRSLASKEEAQDAVDVLEDLHWLHPVHVKTEGRWTTRFFVNPQVMEEQYGKVA